MDALNSLFKSAPEIAIFLSIAIGYLVGRVKVGFFQLGNVAGTLLAAVIIGQVGVTVSPQVKAVCFALFIFSVGFKSGPQFFASLNRASVKHILLSVVVCVTGLFATFFAAKLFSLDIGTAAGVLAGSCTESAMIGTAGEAIGRLGLDAAERTTLENNIAVGYAMTYLFGTLAVILFVRSAAPKLLGVNLKESAKEYEATHGSAANGSGGGVAYLAVALRAYRVTNATGSTIGAVLPKLGQRVMIGRILRGDDDVEVRPTTVLLAGDVLGISGERGQFDTCDDVIGPEVEDERVLSDVAGVADVVVTNKEIAGRTLAEISRIMPHERRRGVYLQSLQRQGRVLPRAWNTRIERGDVVRLVGWKERLGSVVESLGYEERPTEKTDLVYLAIGVVLGTILGVGALTIGGVPLTLGTGGGVLVSGLVFGWLRSRQRRFGSFPPAAQIVLSDFGLAAFVAVVGLTAGPQMFASIAKNGPQLVLIGIAIAVIPQIVGLAFGSLVLRLHPLILLGGLAGSQTVTAALNAVLEEADSSAPVVGYTVTYAIGNVLLTLWGPVLVAMLS